MLKNTTLVYFGSNAIFHIGTNTIICICRDLFVGSLQFFARSYDTVESEGPASHWAGNFSPHLLFSSSSSSSLGQGLAGLWGQDTDQAGTFWGVVNISLCAFSAQLGWRLTWNQKKRPRIMKNHEDRPGTLNNHKTHLEPWKTNLEPWKTIKTDLEL